MRRALAVMRKATVEASQCRQGLNNFAHCCRPRTGWRGRAVDTRALAIDEKTTGRSIPMSPSASTTRAIVAGHEPGEEAEPLMASAGD